MCCGRSLAHDVHPNCECHLGLALCASLSFNVAFLAAQRQAPLPEATEARPTSSQQFAALTNTLDLSAEQRQACRELSNTWNAERKVLGESIGLLRQEVRMLMDGSPVDLIALRERTDRIAELHHERRRAGLARMEEFLTLLTPEQAKSIRKLRPEELIPHHHERQRPRRGLDAVRCQPRRQTGRL